MEVENYLLGFKDLKIIQNTEWFKFSLDSVLLANFITIRSNAKKIIDLGTGNAPIPLILSTRTNTKIYGVEIQKAIYELAIKSVSINNLSDRIKILNEDVKIIDTLFETDTFDVITSNPPYFKINEGSLLNHNDCKTIARHEVLIEIEDILRVSRKLLRNNGVLGLVHRPERLLEILNKMKEYNIMPKRIRFIYPKKNFDCNMVLIEGSKNGKEGLKILPPLFINDENGDYTDEVKNMFGE
ncbi:MAG: tRNA1(Val) (adenine(37)-N6)-methyltransferase [Bacilli bacterium]|nr:tRNA1(Val) (adenine(37)-N6)-methyltransferase [Bacilli bacterium]MDD3304655.1 tRNA1(Val) (adenine(37)-N6)-methyltransferase [Bacilli bacterium]MDD4053293.1 tRNA1(Val) (adenine(37)-N6)-methyltransferase [Bacilli bacterium]MDD4411366.1 tRNA1(Val) (adenine(37)-N6)-methyltransferase [Bacilli bacterium]